MKSQRAFTLIEVLFVIALLSVMAAFSISLCQQKSENERVDKTALEMQQIMQAAILYHSDTGNWPDSRNTNGTFETQYILLNGKIPQTAWGKDFSYYLSTVDKNIFQVIAPVSTKQIAGQLSEHLPFANIAMLSGGYTVTAQEDVLSTANNSSPYIITGLGSQWVQTGGVYNINVTCPANWTAHLWTSLNSVEITPQNVTQSWTFSPETVTSPCTPFGANTYQCPIDATANVATNLSLTRLSYSYIAYCTHTSA